MCRFVAYRGTDLYMSDLLLSSPQSLIRQSYHARERAEPLNGDGFGVGWYAPEIDQTPVLFTSVQPAWGNRNLARLAPKIKSGCFFAHVRAASKGSAISELNCHPFQHQRFLWMHNGRIASFRHVKRRLQNLLSDPYYDVVLGSTDSEHAFALFLQHLGKTEPHSLESLEDAVTATIEQLDELTGRAGVTDASQYNFAVTDGENVVVTRYVSDDREEPETLYVSRGTRLEVADGEFRMIIEDPDHVEAVIVASEPLTDIREDWHAVPKNHLVGIPPDLELRMRPIR